MIFARLKSRDGFTLVELLLFSVIFALVTMAFIGIFVVMTRIQSRENSNISITQESQLLLQKMQTLIQQSSLIEMTADVATTTIKLRMPSSTSDPTYIYVSSSQAFLRETDSGSPQPLTSDRVVLSSTSFIKRSNPRGYDSIKISFTIAPTASSSQSSSQAISTSIGRTSPAVFDSDLQSVSGQSIRLGVGYEDIDSINRTLIFRGGNMGVGANGETPKERLQIDDGGLKFSNLPPRPTCTSALRGTLWFQASSTGDSLAMCMLSTTGAGYYWTGDLPDDFTPVAVDGPVSGQVGSSDNVGQYTSIAAITPTIGASTTLYVSYFNNTRKSLMFVKSTSSGAGWFGRTEVHYTGTISGIGHDNSITAPTTSTIFLSYYNQNNPGLWFASSSNHGDSWGSPKQIVSGSGEGQYTAIAAHDSSTIYISYFGGSSDLMFAKSTNGGNTFTTSSVDTAGVTGKYGSMRAVGTSTIYILYFGGGNLKLARSDDKGDSWSSFSTVASGLSDVGRGNDIATVNPSTVFVVYYDQSGSNSLKFNSSTNHGVGWGTPQTLRTNVSRHMSLATPDGTALFVGYQSTAGTNGYGVIRSFDRGATWPVDEIKDSGGSTGEYNSMAATDGSAFSSYWNNNGSNNQLKSFQTLYPRLFNY